MKKILKVLGLFILILFIIVAIVGFIYRAQIIAHFLPTVTQIGNINIRIKNDTTYVDTRIVVKNNAFLNIEIDTIDYSISLFDNIYLQNKRYIGSILKKYETDTLDIDVKIPYITILKDLKEERKKGDSASYSINISLHYATVFGKAKFPINKSSKLKLPTPPEIKIVEIKYKKVRWKYILIDAKIKVVNYSDFSLSINDISYSLSVFKQGNIKGNIKEPININPKETTYINIPFKVNMKSLGKTVFNVIINKDNYDYTLSLDAVLQATTPFKQSFPIEISKTGKMELIK